MKQNKSWMIIVMVFVVIMAGAYVIYHMMSGQTEPEAVGNGGSSGVVEAPDFIVVDDRGEEVLLSDFVGKPVVLNFWASWCGPCKSEMSAFDKLFGLYGEDVQFMMVNLTDGSGETVETASRYVDEEGYGFPVYYDVNTAAAAAYGITSIPATYFIDRDGNIAAYYMGAMDEEPLKETVRGLME